MRIIKFEAENVKKLKSIEITPEGTIVFLSGENGQGKTSVMDAIWLALGGANAVKETKTERPIRDGAKKARSFIDLGDFKVTRTWTSNDQSYLKIKGADGKNITSPQELLDSLLGKLSFDPFAFSMMSDKEQYETLQELVELPFDPAELAKKKKDIFDQRTLINREMKQLDGELAGLKKPSDTLPEKELDLDEILADLEIARNTLRDNETKRTELKQLRVDCQQASEKVKKLKAALEEAQKDYEQIVDRGVKLGAEVDKLVDPEVDKLTDSLRQINDTNKAIRDAIKYREVENKLSIKKASSDELTAQIKSIDHQKEQAIREAKMPIEGLGFGEEGIVYFDVPFGQCSDAEKIRVSTAIAMAKNPHIRIIRITKGSLLDKKSLKIIEEMAEKEDFQVWIEVVDDSKNIGIYIEDGQIVTKGAAEVA